MRQRHYGTYEEYLAHQRAAAEDAAKQQSALRRRETAAARYDRYFACLKPWLERGARCLCLGARYGEEVEALQRMGYDAVGLDLVAHPPLVLAGDMHDTALPGGAYQLVYSNAVDHVHDPRRFAAEVSRLLAVDGLILLTLAVNVPGGRYESLELQCVHEVMLWFDGFEPVRVDRWTLDEGGMNTGLLLRRAQKGGPDGQS